MNPIPLLPSAPRPISVTDPLSPAFERMKTMLFRPFQAHKWFAIGFCAWLAQLGENGGRGFNGNFGGGNSSSSSSASARQALGQTRDFVVNNLAWIIPAIVGVFVLFIALVLLILWLNCRGKFMFLHCVAHDRAEVVEPWHEFAREGNSLFFFRLILQFAGGALTLLVTAPAMVMIILMVKRGHADLAGILIVAGAVFLFIALAIAISIVVKFTKDLVVPIMFLRRNRCLDAWRELWSMIRARLGLFALYILFQIALALAIGTMITMVVLFTCCTAGCVMIIPYLGTVLLLPVEVFRRSYSLYFLAQFGPAYDVFAPPSGGGRVPPA